MGKQLTKEDFYKICLEKAKKLSKKELEKGIVELSNQYRESRDFSVKIMKMAFDDLFFSVYGECEYEAMLDRNDF